MRVSCFSNMRPLIVVALLAVLPAIIHAKGKKCGLPPFVGEMPAEAAGEVRAIWRNYRNGDDCVDRRDRTKDVLDRLSPETRDRIFHHGPLFLRGTSDEVRSQFKALYRNKSLSYDEKVKELRALAAKVLNKKQLAEFNKFDTERERSRKEFAEKVEKLSPAAKEVYDKLEELKKERAKIFEGMTPEVRSEIEELMSKRPRGTSGSSSDK